MVKHKDMTQNKGESSESEKMFQEDSEGELAEENPVEPAQAGATI